LFGRLYLGSKLIAKSYLNFFGSVEDVRAAAELGAGLTKGVTCDATIAASEGVTVESVCEIRFEGQHMRFIEGEAFDEREVLIEIARISDVAKCFGEVAKGKSIGLNNPRRIGIEKRGAVEEIVRSARRKRAVGIRRASAAAQEWVVRRRVRSQQRLSRNTAQPGIGGSERVRLAERKGDERYTFLVTLNTADLPSAQHLVHNTTVVQEFLSLADGQLVQVTEHKHVRHVLITQCLFRPQVVGILRQKRIGAAKGRQSRIRAIRVG